MRYFLLFLCLPLYLFSENLYIIETKPIRKVAVLIGDKDTGRSEAFIVDHADFEEDPSIDQIISHNSGIYWERAQELFPEESISRRGLLLKWGRDYWSKTK